MCAISYMVAALGGEQLLVVAEGLAIALAVWVVLETRCSGFLRLLSVGLRNAAPGGAVHRPDD